ncbi:MAG: NAD kinase [Lentimicrobium sp.]
MKIALFGKNFADDRFFYFQQLIEKLEQSNILVTIYAPFYDFVKSKAIFTRSPEIFNEYKQLHGNADFLFSIGGDGTMLDAITLVRDSGLPLMGVNLGRMGFLSSISKNEISLAIDAILKKEFTLEKRSLLSIDTKGDLFGELNYALNEFTINKKDSGSMILVHVYINELLLNSYWADGLIIATPTGSTAYSLSCNGPIITPDSENFVITPIAAHNLTVRPVVIPDKSVIRIEVDGRISQYLASLDSRSVVISSSAGMIVRKASFHVNLVQPRNYNFFTTIRQKLLWGQDIRN